MATDEFGGVALDEVGSENPEGGSGAAVPAATPVTFYSLGKSIGGADETEDGWTNRGYGSEGHQNLTPGVVAVNTKRYPIGTVFRDTESGQVFLAADKHGNEDPNVVDVYVSPDSYQPRKVTRNFAVVGKLDEIPATADGVREALAQFGTVPDGESAAASLAKLGALEPGNIDLHKRPVVHNEDGSISTVRSISFEEDGKTILVPTVVGDKVVSDKEAIAHYHKTGEHLGKFKNSAAADSYAQSLHEAQAQEYGGRDEFGGVPVDAAGPQKPKDERGGEQAGGFAQGKDEFGGELTAPWWIDGNKLMLDPARYREGLKGAHDDGLLSDADFAKLDKEGEAVEKARAERQKLVDEAGDNPAMKAVLYGVGKGGAATLSAIGAGAAGAAVGSAFPIVGTAAGAIVMGAGGAILGAAAYDQAYKQLAKWDDEYASVLASKEIEPGYAAGGELAFVALTLPASAVNMARGIATVARAEGAVEGAKFAAKAVALGAGTSAATDTGVRLVQAAAGDKDAAPTVGTALTSAGIGVLTAGLMAGGKRYSLKDLFAISEKARAGKQLTAEEAEAMTKAAQAVAEVRGDGQRVTNVTTEQASILGQPKITRPTVTVEGEQAGRQTLPGGPEAPEGGTPLAKLGSTAQEQFENLAARAGRPIEGGSGNPEVGSAGAAIVAAPKPGPQGDERFAPPATSAPDEFGGQPMEDPFAIEGDAPDASDYVAGGDEEAMTAEQQAAEAARLHAIERRADQAEALRLQRDEAGSRELLAAIEEAGGLPGRGSQYEAPYKGELQNVRESAGRGRNMRLFRSDAPDPDRLVTSLRDQGFAIEGPNQLWDMLDHRLRSGQELWSEPDQADPYWAARQGLLREDDTPEATDREYRRQLQGLWNGSGQQTSLQLGNPSPAMRAAGVPDGPMYIKPETALAKPLDPKHPYPPFKMMRLAKELRRPVLIHESWTHPDALVAILDMEHQGQPFAAALHMRKTGQGLEVTEIASLYPRDWRKVTGALQRAVEGRQGRILYYDKAKIERRLNQHSGSNPPQYWLRQLDALKVPSSETVSQHESYSPAQVESRANQATAELGQRPVTGLADVLAAAENPKHPTGQTEGERLLAVGFQRQLIKSGRLDLAGVEVRSFRDLALAGQAYRDPRFETTRWVLVRGGKVVDTLGVTAHHPRLSPIFAEERDFRQIVAWASEMGAAEVWLLHNHPSGDPTPSEKDHTLTQAIAKGLGSSGLKFGGHVVIDGTRFFHIDAQGTATEHHLDQTDELLKPEWDHELLNLPMTSGAEVQAGAEIYARLASDQRGGEGQVTLFLLNTKRAVRAVTTLPAEKFVDRAWLPGYLRARGSQYGASFAVAYYDGVEMQAHIGDAMGEYIRGGVLDDGLLSPSRRLRGAEGVLPEEGADGNYFGEDIPDRGLGEVVREDAAAIEDAGGRLADEALKEGAVRVLSADGKNLYPAVPLVGLKDIRIIEMPEMVALAKELTGSTPEIRRMRSALGQFVSGGKGQIRLHPGIFADSMVAAKVLAHEIGHLVDYLPDGTMKRGNIVGRLLTLKNHLKATAFGSITGVSNAKVKDELLALTRYWKPWDPATMPPWYTEYRQSGVELYADAISVLFNSPATLKQMAPTFYREFFAHLDKKPEVKQVFFDLQALLHRPMMDVLRGRSANVQGMFGTAEEVFLRKRAERAAQHTTVRGYIDLLKEQLYDRYWPIIKRQRAVEKGGAQVADELRPDRLFDEHPMADNLTYTWLKRVWERVLQPLEAAEITQEDLGEYLFFSRIMADRSGVANPLGHTERTARAALLRMRLDMGQAKFTLLERGAEAFHDYVFQVVKDAADAGLISQETFKTVIAPNRKTYAAFRPIEHVEDYVPAGVYQTVGTLKEIENPWLTTILKAVAMHRAIQYQKAKAGTVDFLKAYFPAEIRDAQTRYDGRRNVALRPKQKGDELLEVREDGAWKSYEVPEDVARMFDRVDPAQAHAAVRALNWVFKKGFYPLWVKYNPVFQLALSPIRDAGRLYVNMPKAGAMKLAAEYVKAMPTAARRLSGNDAPIVTEMYENLALATPHDSYTRNLGREDAFEEILRQFHMVAEPQKPGWRNNAIVKPVLGFLRGIEFVGQILEATPKIASYKILTKDLGWNPRDAASYVRNYVGVPNYLRKGRKAFTMGSVFPFWNVAVQGLASDAALMTGKESGLQGAGLAKRATKSAASWWFRWMLAGGLYAVIQALARSGAFGDDAKDLYGGVSDYDNTNYMIVPLGLQQGGDYGRKVLYVRIPQDEMHRVTNGLLKKFIETAARHLKGEPSRPAMNDLAELMAYGGGQLPGVNPIVGIGAKWKEYMEGLNPWDSFRGRHVLSNAEYLAGGWESLKPMLGMTFDQSGLGNFYRYNPEAETVTEAVIANAPVIQRLVKISDRGYAESQERALDAEKSADARLRLKMPENVQKLAGEFSHLRSLGTKGRTPQQQVRYDQLKAWNRVVYTPAYEAAQAQDDAGLKVDFSGLGAASKGWEK